MWTKCWPILDYGSARCVGVAAGEDLEFCYTDSTGTEIFEIETTGILDHTADIRHWRECDGTKHALTDSAPVIVRFSGVIMSG
ncbi:MAG: hypothetical protein F4Z35_02330 [Dehalococcoidia bacterium]|nr:hypothetical protein [Dehalococcoidia bacterium]